MQDLTHGQIDRRSSLKHYLFNTPMGSGLIAVSFALFASGVAYLAYTYLPPSVPVIIQKNVLGNPQPELFIERDGVKYYSHVDGKDISDLVTNEE